MTNETTSGACLCGSVQITTSGDSQFSVMCYCRDCQRITGAGNLPQTAFNKTDLVISGEVKIFQWRSDGGNDLELGSCVDCGSPIYKATSKLPDALFIPVGILSDQAVFHSPFPAFIENRPAWDPPSANETE